MATQLAKALEYTDFRNYLSVIEKSKEAIKNIGQLKITSIGYIPKLVLSQQ